MEGYVNMKYNIFEVMIILALILFCFEDIFFWIAGAVFMTIGGIHVINHEEKYLEESNKTDCTKKRKDNTAA
jgi:hypothetical protein